MFSQTHVTTGKTNIIPIKTKIDYFVNEDSSPKGEYSLKENFFDPSKSSPPNTFIVKLKNRMTNYDSFASYYENMNRPIFDKE